VALVNPPRRAGTGRIDPVASLVAVSAGRTFDAKSLGMKPDCQIVMSLNDLSAIRLVIVDPYPVFALGLRAALDAHSTIDVVECTRRVADAASAIANADAVLLGTTADAVDRDEIAEARRLGSAALVVALNSADDASVRAAFGLGADGLVLRDSQLSIWLWAIEAAVDGGKPLDPRATIALLSTPPTRATENGRRSASLTKREYEVLRMLTDGLANKHIARQIGVAERTVKAHLTSIYAHLGVQNRTQAVQAAFQLNVLGEQQEKAMPVGR
jgi:DNA-binding NarL/FixJ family response regulator